MEVEVTWGRVVRVWWAYAWRNVIAIIIAMIAGGIVGFILGFVMGAAGVSPRTIAYITGPIGAVMGVAFSVVPMKMILGKDFGQFRLVLVSRS
jgi:hypothetical protein